MWSFLLSPNTFLLFWASSVILAWRGCWTLSKIIPSSIQMTMRFPPLSLFWITLMMHVEPSLHSEVKPAWPWCTIWRVLFHSVSKYFINLLIYMFFYKILSVSVKTACGFYAHYVHIWFGYHLWLWAHGDWCYCGFHSAGLAVFPPFCSIRQSERCWHQLLFNGLVELGSGQFSSVSTGDSLL